MMNKLIIIALLAMSLRLYAQDPVQSQFFGQMQFTNPAACGLIPGDKAARVSLFHRSQWTPLSMESYRAMGIAFEYRICLADERSLAFGGQVQHDGAQLGGWKNNRPQVMFGYHHHFGRNTYAAAGAQWGALQSSIDPNSLTFDAQFNSLGYSSTNSTGEAFPTTSYIDDDLQAGLLLYNTEKNWVAGFAFHHINQPKYSFLTLASGTPTNTLNIGFTLHGSWSTDIGWKSYKTIDKGWKVHGMLKKQSLAGKNSDQGRSQQWQLLSGVVTPNLLGSKGFHCGAFVRMAGRSPRGWLPDSFVCLVKVQGDPETEYPIELGLSYDVLLSQIGFGNKHNGAFELCLSLPFWNFENCVNCPRM